MELSQLTQSQKAVRLIYKGLKPTASALRDREYGELLLTWEADPAFRSLVQSHADMMDLDVLDATPSQIILRPSRTESLFRMSLPQARGNQLARTHGLFAIALVAIGAAFYPSGADLVPDAANRLQMTVGQIEEILSDLCDRIADANGGQDPVDDGEEAVETWRILRSMARSSDGEVRGGYSNREAVVRKVVDVLVEHNMLREDKAGVSPSYIATERLRLQMRAAMTLDIYEQCVRLLGGDLAGKGSTNA